MEVDVDALLNGIEEKEKRIKRDDVVGREEKGPSDSEVFLSYAHRDRKWRDELLTMLTPALRANAQSGLQRALAMQQAPPQAMPVQPVYVQAAPVYIPAAAMRYEKDYLPEALISW